MHATPYVENETATLRGFLQAQRATLTEQVEGLDQDQLGRTLAPSAMTLGGLIKHLAYVEDWWFGQVLAGEPPVAPWDAVDWEVDEDWDWHSAVEDEPDDLRALFAAAVRRADAILDRTPSLDLVVRRPGSGRELSARWILVHMIEEYARHLGHADLLRESIDGVTGL